jgi:hypothetical protein
MSKIASIPSLVRAAARSEEDFINSIHEAFDGGDMVRAAEYFERLNIPRSQGAESGLHDPIPNVEGNALDVQDYISEHQICSGMHKYMERHIRKIKWHSTHPSIEGMQNVLLLFRHVLVITSLRLKRLNKLLDLKEELNPNEWAIAREITNRTYLGFRNFLHEVSTSWIDSIQMSFDPADVEERLGSFYEFVDTQVRQLEEEREVIETRRAELTVIPEGYPPVKPPNYFGGDVFGRGPWQQYWKVVDQRAHKFRESVG